VQLTICRLVSHKINGVTWKDKVTDAEIYTDTDWTKTTTRHCSSEEIPFGGWHQNAQPTV